MKTTLDFMDKQTHMRGQVLIESSIQTMFGRIKKTLKGFRDGYACYDSIHILYKNGNERHIYFDSADISFDYKWSDIESIVIYDFMTIVCYGHYYIDENWHAHVSRETSLHENLEVI